MKPVRQQSGKKSKLMMIFAPPNMTKASASSVNTTMTAFVGEILGKGAAGPALMQPWTVTSPCKCRVRKTGVCDMKHGKRPTRRQKVYISSLGLNPENWLIISEDKNQLTMVHRHTDKIKVLPKIN
jgi:hypothetical protein